MSNENAQNGAYGNQVWNHHSGGEGNSPRRPNPATESRVLSMIQKKQEQESQPKLDFSHPPPSGTQPPQINSTQKSQQQLTLPEAPSQLSADAKEFVPRAKFNDLSVAAAEFVPRGAEDYASYGDQYYSQQQQTNPYEGYSTDANYLVNDFGGMNLQDPCDQLSSYDLQSPSTGNRILDRFSHTLYVLNMHPGNMEEYLRPICEMIQQSPDATEAIVNDMVESLFEQSIMEPNFRYTGARICQYLSSNLKSNPYFAGFHKIFIKRCQKDYNKREELKNGNADDQERLRGLAMFMAEIFLNVEAEAQDGTVGRLQFLPKILIDFVQTLLSKPTDLDVKCACQLLKLSGGLIEDIVKNKPDECIKFEETFTQLQGLKSTTGLSENCKLLIDSVIKLKEGNWNRSSASPPKKSFFSFSSEVNHFQAPEPVFYNQMGTPCSRTEAGIPDEENDDDAYILNDEEEAAFLQWQAEQEALTGDPGAYNFNDTGYDTFQLDEGGDEGGMGDDIEAAYEEFLQEQSFMQNYQSHQTAPPVQSIPPNMPPMYNQPPPNVPPHQDYYGNQPQLPPQHMMPPGIPPNQMPPQQQHPDQQHQQQQQQHSYPYSYDRFHYQRR